MIWVENYKNYTLIEAIIERINRTSASFSLYLNTKYYKNRIIFSFPVLPLSSQECGDRVIKVVRNARGWETSGPAIRKFSGSIPIPQTAAIATIPGKIRPWTN